MTVKQTQSVILSEHVRRDWAQRVSAAGGHFKVLPLAEDVVPSVRKARVQATESVLPSAPRMADVIQQQKRRG